MKLLFIVFYTVISTYPAPCSKVHSVSSYGQTSCLVYHGMITDTTRVEVITTDTAKVNRLLIVDPTATVDTFYMIPVNMLPVTTKINSQWNNKQ